MSLNTSYLDSLIHLTMSLIHSSIVNVISFFIREYFKVKNVSITVNYTLHMKPDIINLLQFYTLIKYYVQMQFDSYKLSIFSNPLLGGKIYFVFTALTSIIEP